MSIELALSERLILSCLQTCPCMLYNEYVKRSSNPFAMSLTFCLAGLGMSRIWVALACSSSTPTRFVFQ